MQSIYILYHLSKGRTTGINRAPLAGTAVFSTDVGIARDICLMKRATTARFGCKIEDDLFEIVTKQRAKCLEQYAVKKVVSQYEEHFTKSIS